MDIKAINRYFSFTEHPFISNPDPRFLYPIYMYGPIGCGKTSLVRRLHEKLSLDETYNVKLLIAPNVKSSNALLRLILETFDVKTERSYTASLANAERFLLEEYRQGRKPVLLVDEAQYLNRETLKLVHYLLNFETNTAKLLQIVLVGQEDLGVKIGQYRELASRMFPIAMNAMSPDGLRDMVQFRLTVAGYRDSLFRPDESEAAWRLLYAYTKGLPRDAIKLCFELLIDLAVRGKRTARAVQVEEIAKGQNLSI